MSPWCKLPDGAWLACYNSYTKGLVSQCMVTSSKDDGASWSRPAPMAELDARTRSAPIVLASGDIVTPIYKAPGNGSIAARSSDGGKSWTLAEVPDVENFVGDEWDLLEVEKGRIVGIIRENEVRDGYFWKTESRDGGRSWDRPVKTNVRDAPIHLAGAPRPARQDPGFDLCRPPDDFGIDGDDRRRRLRPVGLGKTVCPCYQYRPDGQPINDGSYPVSVAVGEHRRLIVDYEIRPEGKWIAGYFVDLPSEW